jgi:hypothetical protein
VQVIIYFTSASVANERGVSCLVESKLDNYQEESGERVEHTEDNRSVYGAKSGSGEIGSII